MGCSNMFWGFMILAVLPTGYSHQILKVCNSNSTPTGYCDANKWTNELKNGCFRSFRRSNYIGGAKQLCDLYQGNFTLDVIPYIAPEILCIQNPVRSYFVDGIYKNGTWVTLDGSTSLNFTNFPGFKQNKCNENSVLIWYPFKTRMNWFGVLKCKGLSTKAGTMCFKKIPTECTLPTFTKANGQKACYFMVTGNLNNAGANAACIALGARLPEVRSSTENADINSIKFISTNQWGGVWLGLNSIVTAGNYLWESDKSVAIYTNWGPTQPSGGNQKCVVMINGGFWDDGLCGSVTPIYKTMCEVIF